MGWKCSMWSMLIGECIPPIGVRIHGKWIEEFEGGGNVDERGECLV